MTKRYSLSTQCRSKGTQEKAAALGYASMIMLKCKRSSKFQMRTLDFWIRPAIDHQQIAFFFVSTGEPVGYVIWAHLAVDVEQRLLEDPDFLLHPSEWNEGGRTWIIDICFPDGGVRDCVSQLKEIFHKADIKKIFWTQRNSANTIKNAGHHTLKEIITPKKSISRTQQHIFQHKKVKKILAMALSILAGIATYKSIEHWNLYYYLKSGMAGLIVGWLYGKLKKI